MQKIVFKLMTGDSVEKTFDDSTILFTATDDNDPDTGKFSRRIIIASMYKDQTLIELWNELREVVNSIDDVKEVTAASDDLSLTVIPTGLRFNQFFKLLNDQNINITISY